MLDSVLRYETNSISNMLNECSHTGRKFNHKKQMIDQVISTLNNFTYLSFEEFKRTYNKDFIKEFWREILLLKKIKAVKIENDKLTLLSKTKKERFFHLSYFISDSDIIKSNKRFERNLKYSNKQPENEAQSCLKKNQQTK